MSTKLKPNEWWAMPCEVSEPEEDLRLAKSRAEFDGCWCQEETCMPVKVRVTVVKAVGK